MSERDFKGIWIPKELWFERRLSAFDKILLLEIDSLDNEDGCWKTNKNFAEFMQCGTATITRSISKMEDLGFIKCIMKTTDRGTSRIIKVIWHGKSKRLEVANQNDSQDITIENNHNNSLSWLEKAKTEYLDFCQIYFEMLLSNGKVKKNMNWKTKAWYDAARLMVERDGETLERMHQVCSYVDLNIDEPYFPQVWSLPSLREKWLKVKSHYQRNNR